MELAELIFEKRLKASSPEWFAELFGNLMWLTEDNGAEIWGSLRRWLESDDPEKVRIALAFDASFLWESATEMDRLLSGVLARFPTEAHRCEVLRSAYMKQFPDAAVKHHL